MTEFDKIIDVKDKLREKLKWNNWYRGIRITTNTAGKFIIKIIVSEINETVFKIVPINFEGVTVTLNEFTKEEFPGE